MKRFYLSGQTHFGNRGCEALVRSTVGLIEAELGPAEFLVPSFDAVSDAAQWPQAADHGVRFVPVPIFPENLRWWSRAQRLWSGTQRWWLPAAQRVDAVTLGLVRDCDAVLMIGGDVITLDYGAASMLWNTGMAETYLREGVPTMLWAASTGPFDREPVIEAYMRGFYGRLHAISVRESFTLGYLDRLGLGERARLVADPAFALAPEPVDDTDFWPEASVNGVLGFNISPVIQKFRPAGESPAVLQGEVAAFLRAALDRQQLSVLLLPHVDSLNGSVERGNSDSAYLGAIHARLGEYGRRVTMVPPGLNAAQLKYLAGRCRYFIGGRTHSTIAALSQCVPTLSIAYSVKAQGINRDLFGDTRHVLETPRVSQHTLAAGLDTLVAEEASIRERLTAVMPRCKANAAESATMLARLLED
ncbi:MAG: hypothetical protein AMXMBFR6_02120 [Betaproteobacteria bacterium]